MVNPQPITRSPRLYGRYSVGDRLLTSGDLLEWQEENGTRTGTVEYTYAGYFVRTPQGSIPLRELVRLQRVGNVRRAKQSRGNQATLKS